MSSEGECQVRENSDEGEFQRDKITAVREVNLCENFG